MRRGGQGGFVLVSVLGALIVLTGLAAAAAYLVRTAVLGAAAIRSELFTDALTRAGLEIAGFELFELKRPAASVNGQQIRLDDGVVTLFVAAESGKIDLNTAAPEILASLWASLGLGGLAPEQFAARVKDYRDADSEPGEKGGAELQDYQAAAADRAPANAPFDQVDDIQFVLGVTPDAARALAPLLTVHNPGGKVSAYDASAAVVRALPQGASVVDRIMALRSAPLPRSEEEAEAADKAAQESLGEAAKNFGFERTSNAYTVRVEVARGDARRATQAILTRSRASDALYFTTDLVDRP